MNAIDKFSQHARLTVEQHVIIRAVQNLDKLEALALIRGAFTEESGSFATLEEAQLIYKAILLRN